jgi:hypothetical protein
MRNGQQKLADGGWVNKLGSFRRAGRGCADGALELRSSRSLNVPSLTTLSRTPGSRIRAAKLRRCEDAEKILRRPRPIPLAHWTPGSSTHAPTNERENMNNRLYVGNLSYDVTTEALRACFAECGQVVDAHVATDRETGRARGFAFVTMATEAEATHAIAQLNNAMFEGRPLRVSVAEERSARDQSRNPRGGHKGW